MSEESHEEGWGIHQFSNEAHYFVHQWSLCETYGTGDRIIKSFGEKRCSKCELEFGIAVTAIANQLLLGGTAC